MEHMTWVFFNVLQRLAKLCLNLPQTLQETDQCLSLWHINTWEYRTKWILVLLSRTKLVSHYSNVHLKKQQQQNQKQNNNKNNQGIL